jgi:hypothetical protein
MSNHGEIATLQYIGPLEADAIKHFARAFDDIYRKCGGGAVCERRLKPPPRTTGSTYPAEGTMMQILSKSKPVTLCTTVSYLLTAVLLGGCSSESGSASQVPTVTISAKASATEPLTIEGTCSFRAAEGDQVEELSALATTAVNGRDVLATGITFRVAGAEGTTSFKIVVEKPGGYDVFCAAISTSSNYGSSESKKLTL